MSHRCSVCGVFKAQCVYELEKGDLWRKPGNIIASNVFPVALLSILMHFADCERAV